MRPLAALRPGSPLPEALAEVTLPGLPLFSRGKVRTTYDVSALMPGGKDATLLMIATDRISAFDVVMREPIPAKGYVLTALSEFWFARTGAIVPNHLLAAHVEEFPAELRRFEEQLAGRALLVRRAERIDVECVARGYLAGSGWQEYRERGTLAGEPLPLGLRESERLPEPRFTPAIKAASGHDENISVARMAELVGTELTARLAHLTLALYRFGHAYAVKQGLILADTKFEFGRIGEELILIDEALTPDSSRFWPAAEYRPGGPQPSFDKQYLRDFLLASGWNREPPPPPLPAEVIRQTAEKYREAYVRLVGSEAGGGAPTRPAVARGSSGGAA